MLLGKYTSRLNLEWKSEEQSSNDLNWLVWCARSLTVGAGRISIGSRSSKTGADQNILENLHIARHQ